MANLKKAVAEFCQKRIAVYNADKGQLLRDVNAARRAATDHVGRWFWEVFQNADDAEANESLLCQSPIAMYFADNGNGFRPESVEAICGTDFSDKQSGTIGRKGIGFKAVYTITSNPQVFSLNGEGFEFNKGKAQVFLEQHLNYNGEDIPYEWLPFFICRREAEAQDRKLAELSSFRTVVKLPLEDKSAKLPEVPAGHFLLTFRHVRRLSVVGFDGGTFSIELSPESVIIDTRKETAVKWEKHEKTLQPPEEILRSLEKRDRDRIQEDGASLLVAAPLDEDGLVQPTEEYLAVHVFYPADNDISPVRLLLHAEFVVKSDRTSIVPIVSNPYNAWLAERLAAHVVDFVQSCYASSAPAAYVRLLRPFPERDSHGTSKLLWDEIAAKARCNLLLPDCSGKPSLPVAQSLLLKTEVRAEKARRVLERAPCGPHLLHSSVSEDSEACATVEELGCQVYGDQDIVKVIEENALNKVEDQEWLWASWEWLAAWLAEKPYGDEGKERLDRIKTLSLIPVGTSLRSWADLQKEIVTWNESGSVVSVPDWMPLVFVAEWFRNRINPFFEKGRNLESVRKLLDELEIKPPGKDVLQDGLKKAIDNFWKRQEGDPSRFLRFIFIQAKSGESALDFKDLRKCPVPVVIGSKPSWVEAEKAYLGREWGNSLLVNLYGDLADVPWVQPDFQEMDRDRQHDIFKGLGVNECPRVVTDGCDEAKRIELRRVQEAVAPHIVDDGIPDAALLEYLDLRKLQAELTPALLALVARHWESYYDEKSRVPVSCRPDMRYRPRAKYVSSRWWDDVLKLCPPLRQPFPKSVPLSRCWLPDSHTLKAIGDLLPVVDLSLFGEDREKGGEWLKTAVGVRSSIDTITSDEWRDLLSQEMPWIAPEDRVKENKNLRYAVCSWYEACLEALEDKAPTLQDAPLLCHKGKEWKYISHREKMWLNDDDELAREFSEDIYVLDLPVKFHTAAKKVFGLKPLSQEADRFPILGESEPMQRFTEVLEGALPYVFALRRSQTERDPSELRDEIKKIKVMIVSSLVVKVSLSDFQPKEISRDYWANHGGELLINARVKDQPLAYLARALADALGVRSEADFFENLLRCPSEAERKAKLLSRGDLMASETDARLAEFGQKPETKPLTAQPPPAPKPGEQLPASSPRQQPETAGPKQERMQTSPEPATSQKQSNATKVSHEDTPLLLKDPEKEEPILVCGGAAPQRSGTGETGTGGVSENGSGGGSPHRNLTPDEKNRIEGCGRSFAEKILRGLGYRVKQMPTENPGFDIEATKAEERLLVEVKAHLGEASTVDLTARELREYLRCQSQDGKDKWQLWNVENLEAGTGKVRVKRYDHIPDNALEERSFQVVLRRCKTMGET